MNWRQEKWKVSCGKATMNQDPSCWITFWIVTMMKWDAVLWCDLVRTTSISEDDRAQQWDPFTRIDQDENRWVFAVQRANHMFWKKQSSSLGSLQTLTVRSFQRNRAIYPNLSSQMVNFWLQPQMTNILLFMQLPKILNHGLPSQVKIHWGDVPRL